MRRYLLAAATLLALASVTAPAAAADPPAAPTNVKILKESTNYTYLSFRDSSTNETHFSVWRQTGTSGPFVKASQHTGAANTGRVYEVQINDSGRPSCYKVSADNAAGRRYSGTVCTAATGVGWSTYSDTYFVVKPHNLPVSSRFRVDSGVYKTWVYSTDEPHHPDSPTAPRTEMAWNKTYVAGHRMWEADVYIFAGTDQSNIFQIFKADHPEDAYPTDLRIKASSENGGTLKAMNTGTLIATGMYNRWFNLKVAHDVNTHYINIYINDMRVATVLDTSPGTPPPGPGNPQAHRFKNGVYGSASGRAEVHFRNFTFWSRSV